MIIAGVFDLARAQLDSVTIPITTPEVMQLVGFCALRQMTGMVETTNAEGAGPWPFVVMAIASPTVLRWWLVFELARRGCAAARPGP
jgi:hypothetical protein